MSLKKLWLVLVVILSFPAPSEAARRGGLYFGVLEIIAADGELAFSMPDSLRVAFRGVHRDAAMLIRTRNGTNFTMTQTSAGIFFVNFSQTLNVATSSGCDRLDGIARLSDLSPRFAILDLQIRAPCGDADSVVVLYSGILAKRY